MEGLVAQLVFHHGFEPRQLIGYQCVCREWRDLLRQDRFWWRHFHHLHATTWHNASQLISSQRGDTHYQRYSAFAQRVLTLFDRGCANPQSHPAYWPLMARVAFGLEVAQRIVINMFIGTDSPVLYLSIDQQKDVMRMSLETHRFTLAQLELRRQEKKRRKWAERESYVFVCVKWVDLDKTARLKHEAFMHRLLAFVFEPERFKTLKPLLVL